MALFLFSESSTVSLHTLRLAVDHDKCFFPYFGRIPAIAMGPDQLGKLRRRLRGGVGIEGAHVATEGLGVRPASVNCA